MFFNTPFSCILLGLFYFSSYYMKCLLAYIPEQRYTAPERYRVDRDSYI